MKITKLAIALFVLPLSVVAQIDLNSKIPSDPDVRTGTLKNGLKYYIRKNAKPENKVDLRLVVNAGSILETDDQKGLAHFMEHMAFNGTKRFPKNELVDYLQSIGVKFGQHLNAYTSFDETVYFLPIPSDDPQKLEKGFQILEDWAFNVDLTPEEIDKERGVVLEEYRTRLGASNRIMYQTLPKLLYKSRYVDRLPIGTKENLETFKYSSLENFYKDWYRPNLMAVIAVGDINVDEIEEKIKEHFGSYKNPVNEKERKEFDIPNHKETLVAIVTDKEATGSEVNIIYKDKGTPSPTTTIKDFKDDLIDGLFNSMLNNRLSEYTNKPNPPFTFAYSYHGGLYGRAKEGFQSYSSTEEGKQLEALNIILKENERVKLHGFTLTELERAKAEYLAYYERSYNERDKNSSSTYLGRYQTNFLQKEAFPSIEWSFNTLKELLPSIKIEDVNALINDYLNEENRVIVITGPEKEAVTMPSEKQVLASLDLSKVDITPYEDVAVAESLLRKEPKSGKVTDTTKNEKLGTTTLTLSNGAKVTYKKTDFKNDEILFSALSYGGSNVMDIEPYKKSRIPFMFSYIPQAGFSGLNKIDLDKFNSGKLYRVSPYVGTTSEGLSGNATPKDLEYLFQSVHAYFTDLNFDEEAYATEQQKMKMMLGNVTSNPETYYSIELAKFMYGHNPRFITLPEEKDWAEVDYKVAYDQFKKRFQNAGDFEFYFVGNVDASLIKEFSEKYLASLPSSPEKEDILDLGDRIITGSHDKTIYKGTEDKSQVNIYYSGETTYDSKEALAMNALGEILTIKLIEELREEESGVYGAGANGNISKQPYGSYSFTISFPCAPANVDKLVSKTFVEIDKLIKDGPTEKDLNKFKEGELSDYKKDVKENRYWLNVLTSAYSQKINPERALEFENRINALTAADIQNVAKKYLTKDRVLGILKPETAK